jgi:hypothetical protein
MALSEATVFQPIQSQSGTEGRSRLLGLSRDRTENRSPLFLIAL